MSAGPGAIVRVHGVFHRTSPDPFEWRQSSQREINLLNDVSKHFPVKNGYVAFTGSEPKLPNRKDKDYYKLLGKVQVLSTLHSPQIWRLFILTP